MGLYSTEVTGPLGSAEFPRLCLKCGAPAAGNVPVMHLYWRTFSDSPSYHEVDGVHAPFCSSCLQAHAREARPIPQDVKSKLLLSWFIQALPYLFPLGVSLFFVKVTVPILLRTLGQKAEWWETLLTAALVLFFVGLTMMFVNLIRAKGGMLIHHAGGGDGNNVQVETGPLGCCFVYGTEPTSIQQAIHFSDDLSELFEPRRHQYTIENDQAARAFAELNAHRKWDPKSVRAKAAGTGRKLVIGALVVFGIYVILKDILGF
jgi:hypothetical protein